MGRIRSVKPEFFSSLAIADLPNDTCRLFFIGLWTYADDEGRGIDDARLIKAAVAPVDNRMSTRKIESLMQILHDQRRIFRYTVDGKRCFAVENWSEHQHPDRPNVSKLPPPPQQDPPPPDPKAQVTAPPLGEPAANGRRRRGDSAALEGRVEERRGIKNASRSRAASRSPNTRPRRDPGSSAPPTARSKSPPADAGFDEFWDAYPRRVAKAEARRAWTKAHRHPDFNVAVVVAAARRYGADPNRDPAFTAHPATWLSGQRWDDPPLPARNGNGNGHRPKQFAGIREYARLNGIDLQ